MATEVTHVVDPDGGGGYDYLSLNAWESGADRDLQVANEQETVKCRSTSGSADTTSTTISGVWNPDATHYIKIWTDPAESYRHNGTYQTSKYRMELAGYPLIIQEACVRVLGLQIATSNIYVNGIAMLLAATNGDWQIAYNIIKGTSGMRRGIYANNIGTGAKIWNNLVYDVLGNSNGEGISSNIADEGFVRNNTVYGCTTGIISNYDNWHIENNLCNGNGVDYSVNTTKTEDYNVSEDGTQSGANSKKCAVTFIDEGGKNFNLASGDSCAKDSGYDFSADSDLSYSDDIAGNVRSGTWDIGAYEYVAAEVALSGSSAGVSTGSGGLVMNKWNLIGALTGQSAISGTLSFLGSTQALSGATAGTGSTAAMLYIQKALAGSSVGLGGNTGAINLIRFLTGATDGTSTTAGVLNISKAFSAIVNGISNITGAMIVSLSLKGSSAGKGGKHAHLTIVGEKESHGNFGTFFERRRRR